MKTTTHAIPGLISSLLLSAGFSRVAAQFDPVARALTRHACESGLTDACAAPCVMPTNYYSHAEMVG